MNFIVFFAVNIVNVAIIAFLSDHQATEFLKGYSAGNLIFSLILTLLMSSSGVDDGQRRLVAIMLSLLTGLLVFIGDSVWLVGLVYPLALLLVDYAISQGSASSVHIRYRLIGVFTAVTLVVTPSLIEGIEFRAFVLVVVALFLLLRTNGLKKLQINKTIPFLATIYLCYSGVLFLLPRLDLAPDVLKIWYLCAQGGLVLQLKILDFEARGTATISSLISKSFVLAAGFVLVAVQFIYPSWQAFGLTALGMVGLYVSRRVYLVAGAPPR